jgi:eukaryotic-like serine/threonine-protein kinase
MGIVLKFGSFGGVAMLASGSQKLKELYEFGPFRVDPEKEILLRAGEPVPLQPKTFQILLVLVQHQQQVVTKDDLMKAVWPDSFVEEANLSRNIFLLRKALGESPQDHQYILTVPGRGYRFAENVHLVPEQELRIVAAQHSRVQVQIQETKSWGWNAAAIVLVLAIAGGATWLLLHRKPVVAEKVTVVVADFDNSTGDAVFDGTLRQGLSVQLGQSPFLSLISDERIRQTLGLMDKTTDQRLTPEIGRELCQRTGSAAVLDGSIASLGSEYILGLRAVSCRTGDVLAEEQETAGSKEKILSALDQAAAKLRGKLGESLSTVEKFDTPLEQATTPSLEALQAYTMGRQMMVGKDQFGDAVPFFQRAIQLDPNFAMAFAALGSAYRSLGETELGAEDVRRAYERRTRLSQPEKFYIESTYYHYVTGDLERARQVYELSAQIYPRYSGTHLRLWVLYSELGEYEKALTEIREAARLDPSRAINYGSLAANYINLNRFQEARATVNDLLAKQPDSPFLRFSIYRLDFLEDNLEGMQEQVRWAAGEPGAEGTMRDWEAQTAGYAGHMKQSRDLSRRAIDSAMRAQQKENAAMFDANQSLAESLVGNKADARERAHSELRLSSGPEVEYETALGLALAGEESRAQALANDLAKRFPEDTRVQFNFLPTIRAQVALSHKDPLQAIDLLQPAARYELGWNLFGPVYLRGEAYLATHRWAEAAAEFRKILEHRGIVVNHPFGALAHLQLARAYAAAGDKAKAKPCYEDFLKLWKDADSDIPLLKEAKAEYAQLQ